MKSFLSLVALMLALGTATTTLAQDNVLTSYNSSYKGVQYRVLLTMDMVMDTRNFDPLKSDDSSISLSATIRNSLLAMQKIDDGAGWQLYNLQLNQYQRNEGMFWYFTLSFRSTGNEYFQMLATIDGKAAKIRRIEEIDL